MSLEHFLTILVRAVFYWALLEAAITWRKLQDLRHSADAADATPTKP